MCITSLAVSLYQKLKGNGLRNIPLTPQTTPPLVSGEGGGAPGEFRPSGDDGQPGPSA